MNFLSIFWVPLAGTQNTQCTCRLSRKINKLLNKINKKHFFDMMFYVNFSLQTDMNMFKAFAVWTPCCWTDCTPAVLQYGAVCSHDLYFSLSRAILSI